MATRMLVRRPKGVKDGCMSEKRRWLLGNDDYCLIERKHLHWMVYPMMKKENVMFEVAKAPAKGKTDGQNLAHSCPR